jgi:hypothetical protein
MIIGNGDLSSAIKDREDRLYFVSGVSNSSETRTSEFLREVRLLQEQGNKRHLVYFSSISALNGDSMYHKHKRAMENLVKTFPHYTIVRLGNITWGNNPHTLINGLRNKIKNGELIEIRDEYRYLVDKDELQYWLDLIPAWNCEIMIPGKRMKVIEVLQKYV